MTWTDYLARDRWWGTDKLDHLVWSVVLWLALSAFIPALGPRITWFVLGAVGVEVIELVRFLRWDHRGQPAPWPWLTDRFSYRDLVWDVAGALLAAWLLGRVA